MHPTPAQPRDLSLSMRTFAAFHQTVLAHRQLLMRSMRERGMHPGQAFCVAEISHHEGITQSELAESLGVSRPTVSVMLQKLEKAGVIERRTDADDQRFTRLYLTEEGRTRYRTMHTILDEFTATIIEPMSESDRTELVRLLGILAANIQLALDDDGTPGDTDAAELDR
ncbi:MAG: winged helix-turn-helix transcriptional regulator [Coriobacteriia bacterium]|nr:winged helix-turn-helix transcriptional regulator [Coriobacteriia bacterium]